MKNTISVIIPVYNGEKYIEETLQSVLKQDGVQEVLVIDDGSTDKTRQLVEQYQPNVTYYFQENRGVGMARNYGASLALGEYLAFIDADDLWHESKLQKQLESVQEHCVDMAFTYIQHFQCPQASGSSRQNMNPMPGKFSTTLFIKKFAFLLTGGFPESKMIGEFIEWYSIAKSRGLKEIVIPEVLAYRRIHDHNMTLKQQHAMNDYTHVLRAHLKRKKR